MRTRPCLIGGIALALMPISVHPAAAQQVASGRQGPFVAYEIGEMAMNRFRNFAGEIGYRFDSPYQLRLTVMEVDLTERHLSSSWEAYAVDGGGVEGYFRGYELHLDRFVVGDFYVSLNLGYYADTYEHTALPERVENETLTVGSGLGYSRPHLFGVPNLHFNFNLPVRYYFDGIDETKLGDATVREHIIVNNMWLFIGYRF